MFTHRIDADLELRLLDNGDAGALLALVDANRAYLREWLPWVDAHRGEEDSSKFIVWSRRQFAESKDVVAGMCYRGELVGVVGLHGITQPECSAFIGYWIAEPYQGRGIVTRSVRALVTYAFEDLQLHRIEVRCAPANVRSCSIPVRLGFRHEGTLKEATRLYERYEDLLVYAVLKREWQSNNNPA